MKNKTINWNEYFLALAKISAKRSKDPNTQVGACIVSKQNRVLGIGYNGMPKGNDVDFPWSKDSNKASEVKYSYVIHAEINAILNSILPLNTVEDAKLYVSLFLCSNCAKVIAQTGITTIYFDDDKYHHTEDSAISRFIFEKSKIKTIQLKKFNVTIEN